MAFGAVTVVMLSGCKMTGYNTAMDNAISTTMSGPAGAVAFFVVWSLTKRS